MELVYQSENPKPKHYVPLVEPPKKGTPKVLSAGVIVPSKVLIIENLSVTITQDFDDDVGFVINTEPGILSDHKTIPKLDITAKEDIEFDENLTLSKLESIIRRCGILEQYKEYFTNDPEIIINTYTLNIKKRYKYFNEFREGVLIGGEIVT